MQFQHVWTRLLHKLKVTVAVFESLLFTDIKWHEHWSNKANILEHLSAECYKY